MELLLYLKIEELEKDAVIRLARAVQAMRKRQVRVEPKYDGEYGKVVVSTFHGFGLNLLKPWLSLLGRDAGYIILDGDEKFSLLKRSYRCPKTVL